jgi:hypothetical protein
MSVARRNAYLSPGNKSDLLGEDRDLRNLGRTIIHGLLKATTVLKIREVSSRWRCQFQASLTPRTLVRVANANPSSPVSKPNRAHCPSSRIFGSAAQPPMGVLYTFSTTFTNPAAVISCFITSDILKVCPVIWPASVKSCLSQSRSK